MSNPISVGSETVSLVADTAAAAPRIVGVAISKEKGVRKSQVPEISLKKDWGVLEDAHASPGHRQVSLLALESIEKMRRKGLEVGPGDFAENITTSGLDLPSFPIGTHLHVGETVLLRITQIGKECHSRCQIHYAAGDCVMPREGIFAIVLRGGKIRPGDPIKPTTTTDMEAPVVSPSPAGSNAE